MKRIAAIIALLLVIPLISAELVVNRYTNDFTLSSRYNEQIKMCGCETRVDLLVVENTGQFYSDYSLDVATDYPSTLRLAQSSFTLAPKHFKEIPVYIEDSCGVSGTFDYTVTAVNSYGRVERLSRTIRADACQSGALEVTPANRTVGLCEPAVFSVIARNVGTYAESYALDFGPYSPEAAREVYLQPGESHTQDVSFSWSCTDYGEYVVPFALVSARGGVEAQTARTVRILNQYDFALDVKTNAEACGLSTTHIPVTIENLARVPDSVTLRIDGPATFASGEDETTLDLSAQEKREIEIQVPGDTPLGEHDITITARDSYGGIEKIRTTTVSVANCYDPAIEVRIAPDETLEGADIDCCGPKTYYANVRNDGDREQVFVLSLDGASHFVLDDLTVRVRASENVNVPIRADLPCTDETYDATITVFPQGQPQVNASAKLVVESWSERACYRVQIDEDELTVRDDATVVPVIVRHTGLRAGNYTIASNSSIFGFSEEELELRPGEERAIHMVPLANLSEQEKGRYLVSPTLTEEVRGIPYVESLGVKLRGKDLFERFLGWLSSLSLASWDLCSRVALFLGVALAVALVALLLIYAGKLTLFPEGLTRNALNMAKALLALVTIILLLTLAFLDAPAREAAFERTAQGNATVLEWYQNEQLTIDLDEYFTDPDRDDLVYSAGQPKDIEARVGGSMLTLTPDHNFAGENSMVVTASDEKGGVADSPLFILRVIPRREVGFVAWVGLWCKHIIAVLLIGITLVLFLMALTVKERRQDLRRDNVIVVVTPQRRTRKAVRRSARRAPKRRRTKAASRAIATRSLAPAVRPQVLSPHRPAQGAAQANVQNIVNVPGAKTEEIALVGSKTGNTVHTPYCMIARRIPKGKRVAFSSKQEALRAGLVPCKGCRPF